MNCCQCDGIETYFDAEVARRELKRYRKKGPARATKILIQALSSNGVTGGTLLDIGGGIGAIQHELLKGGLEKATNVDASRAYLESAREEASRRGVVDQVTYHHGDFVELASQIDEADIVTLDSVICCYHDMRRLVRLSCQKARKLYGLAYPRDNWLMKLFRPVANLLFRLKGNPFRIFIHPTREVEATVRDSGLSCCFHRKTLLWQVAVYTC